MTEQRDQWKSRAGFVMAAMGSAIGLGNIWRFPYVAYENGGGVFLVPYFIALFLVGIPLMMLEFGLGHKMRLAFPGALRKIDRRFTWIGWWAVTFVMFGIVVYYCVVIAWCLCYFVFAFKASWGADPGHFFVFDFLNRSDKDSVLNAAGAFLYNEETGQWILGGMQWKIVAALAAVWAANWVISFGRVQRGIERANRIFIPLLIVCLVVLVAWSWGFDGADNGRQMYLNGIDSIETGEMNWSRLSDSAIWVAAFSQIFFTLSLGFGIMCAYSSYLPRKGCDIPGNAAITASGNSMFEFFAGFAVFATVGFIASANGGVLPDSLDGPGLCFVTYPTAINLLITKIGFFGNIFGVIFFGALVMAGLSSSISITEAFGAAVQDTFGIGRKATVTVLCSVAFLAGLLFCTQSGLFLLDIVDHFLLTYGLVTVAALETLIVAWYFKSQRMREHLDQNADFQFHNWLGLIMRVVITISLGFLWYGLTRVEMQGLGVSLVRMLTLLAIAFVWLSEHWLDFDYKIVIPALLFFLIDQALVDEITPPYYGGYPAHAIKWVGVGWVAATIIIAVVITLFALQRKDPSEHDVDEEYPAEA